MPPPCPRLPQVEASGGSALGPCLLCSGGLLARAVGWQPTFRSGVCPEFSVPLPLPVRCLPLAVLIRPHTQDVQSEVKLFPPHFLFPSHLLIYCSWNHCPQSYSDRNPSHHYFLQSPDPAPGMPPASKATYPAQALVAPSALTVAVDVPLASSLLGPPVQRTSCCSLPALGTALVSGGRQWLSSACRMKCTSGPGRGQAQGPLLPVVRAKPQAEANLCCPPKEPPAYACLPSAEAGPTSQSARPPHPSWLQRPTCCSALRRCYALTRNHVSLW